MGYVRALYSTTAKPGSGLIRAVTWSHWSHLSIVNPAADEVLEAIAFRGVVATPLSEALARSSAYEFVDYPADDPSAVLAAAYSQEGKPYDWGFFFGVPFHRDWQDPEAWACSELFAWSLTMGGSPIIRADAVHRVTPRGCYIVHPTRRP